VLASPRLAIVCRADDRGPAVGGGGCSEGEVRWTGLTGEGAESVRRVLPRLRRAACDSQQASLPNGEDGCSAEMLMPPVRHPSHAQQCP
jgi:hypothetical protein